MVVATIMALKCQRMESYFFQNKIIFTIFPYLKINYNRERNQNAIKGEKRNNKNSQ